MRCSLLQAQAAPDDATRVAHRSTTVLNVTGADSGRRRMNWSYTSCVESTPTTAMLSAFDNWPDSTRPRHLSITFRSADARHTLYADHACTSANTSHIMSDS